MMYARELIRFLGECPDRMQEDKMLIDAASAALDKLPADDCEAIKQIVAVIGNGKTLKKIGYRSTLELLAVCGMVLAGLE